MTLEETLKKLESLGQPALRQAQETLVAGTSSYGVKPNELEKLRKKLQTNPALAEELWKTSNVDAMILASMVADPKGFDPKALDRWASSIRHPAAADAFVTHVVAHMPGRDGMIQSWTASPREFLRRCGYRLLALPPEHAIPDEDYVTRIWNVARDIHESPNFAREAMIEALIAIGHFNRKLNKECLFAVAQIGPVPLDHTDHPPDALKILTDKKLQKRFKVVPP